MFDDTGKRVQKVGPSTPVQVLGLDGAPQAGEKFQVMETDREARELANKRGQILREQSIRTKKHITFGFRCDYSGLPGKTICFSKKISRE